MNYKILFAVLACQVGTLPLYAQQQKTKADTITENILPEVTITSMLKKSMTFVFAPSALELIRDQLFLKTRYRVPGQNFHRDSRLIIHPYLLNHTTGEYRSFTPIVYDGKHYDILLKRGNICGDPEEKDRYSPYAQVVDKLKLDGMVAYQDSCTVGDINDKYSTEVRIKISTFCQDEYRDTIVIAHGVIYPMRFFNYNCAARKMDDRYAPIQTAVSFNEKGQIHLRFRADDATIYENEGKNAIELKNLQNALGAIDTDATKSLHTFQIQTYASPEGSFEYNLRLVKKRTENAMDKILKNISSETKKKAKVLHNGHVESWSVVYDQLLQDERPEAAELDTLMKQLRSSHNDISLGILRKKYYPVIRDNYLPPLRRVEYLYEYSELRTLNETELDALYQESPEKLTASEFWSYIRQQGELSDEKKDSLYRQALALHPDLMIAANNLAELLIRQNKADTTLLMPFLQEGAPEEIWLNQTAALLQMRDFEKADQMAAQLPDNENSRIVKALAAAMNGKYENAYSELSSQGGLNQVVLLLCMKRNSEAWAILDAMDDHSAEAEYLRAIASNRLDKVVEAMDFLKKAILLNPSLKEIARKDGDVLDLLEDDEK